MRKEDCYFLGKITRRHGLAGNVILKLDTDQPEFYRNLESIFVEINGLLVPFFIEKLGFPKKDTLNISFKNATEGTVDQSLGKNVFLPMTTLPPLSGTKFYYHEVVGFKILDQDGNFCGNIKEINDSIAQHYFILNLDSTEVIIPVIKDWILEVDRTENFIKMQVPEGLLDVYLNPGKNDEQ